MTNETPIDVFFGMLEREFMCGRRAASAHILADKDVKWGRKRRNARQVATGPGDRRQLTDYVSNSLPGSIPPEALDALKTSVPALMKDLVAGISTLDDAPQGPDLYRRIADLFTRVYAYPMMTALADYACAADIFDNVLDSIRDLTFEAEWQRANVALGFYVATAFLGDVELAANLTVQFCSASYGVYLLEEWDPDEAAKDEDAPVDLGVQRIISGLIRGKRHTLDADGTIFGSLPSTEGDFVADVNNSVSFEHCVVYRSEDDGEWYAEGLGSKYGTFVERPGLDQPLVVELPEDQRDADKPTPVRIQPQDVLVMGSTRFEVQLFQHGA